MELQFLSFPFLFMSLSFILFMSLILLHKATSPTLNLPPGPWKLPLIGSIHHLVGSVRHQRLRELSQKYGPLMHLKLGERSTIVVSSPEVAKQVLKTHDPIFAQRPQSLGADIALYGSLDIGLSPYGDYWRQLRKICMDELLSAKRVRSFQSIREAEVSNLIRNISTKTGSSINLGEKIDSMTYAIVARAAFGAKCKDQKTIISVVEEILEAAGEFSVTDLFPSQKWLHVITGESLKLEKMHRKVDMLLENIISEVSKTEGEADGILSVLLHLKDHGALESPLTISSVKAVLVDVLIAGTESSSTITEWAISEMLENPKVLRRAQAEVRHVFGSKDVVETGLHELEYLKAVINETMRLHPPVPLLPRVNSESCEINGYTILVGTPVLVNAWAIGRDPRHWTEAEKFSPERFLNCPIDYKGSNFEFIPFGAGKRICPGLSFGAVNVELALAKLLYYFDWELPFGSTHGNLDITQAFGNSVRRKKDLFVVPIACNPVPLQ